MNRYLGFGANRDRSRIIRLFGASADAPARFEEAAFSDLSEIEQNALSRDLSPSLYHWNNLIYLGQNPAAPLEVVYARGKDFLPFSALDYVEQLRNQIMNPAAGPVTLQIQPNQIRNDACTFCCTKVYRNLPIYRGKRFTAEQLEILLRHHAEHGGQMVELIGGGEPTLHPQFIEILKLISSLGLRAYLFTNGSQFGKLNGELNYPLLEAIAESCALLNVSLDGYRNRQLAHKTLPFEKTRATFAGMEYIHRIRDPRTMGFYNSYILTGGSKQGSNIEDLYETVELQAGWVDSMHIQNDFVSLSHLELDIERTREILQRTIDCFFDKIYLYLNYPLIKRLNLNVPYDLSLHNVSSDHFPRCLRALVAPTVECGSFKVWPCGKYAGEAQPSDQSSFESIPSQMDSMRRSVDSKNSMRCEPCIHSSYNQALQEIDRLLRLPDSGEFFHYYEKNFVERTCCWSTSARDAAMAHANSQP